MGNILKYISVIGILTLTFNEKKIINENCDISLSDFYKNQNFLNSENKDKINLINNYSVIFKDRKKIDTVYYDYLVGKINFSSDNDFVIVDTKYSSKIIYLRKQVYDAFLKMSNAAEKDGVILIIISGARSFSHQKSIWERKWKNLPDNLSDKEKAIEILKYSSMPMTSRHHWGTDFDLNSLENEYFESGYGLKIYKWLTNNASEFGFCQVYSDKKTNNRNGYELEKWHWSYMPLASQVLEAYNKEISIKDFKGFIGCEVASDLKIIENYVNGITTCN